MDPKLFRERIQYFGSLIPAIPVSFDNHGFIDKTKVSAGLIFSALATIWGLRKAITFAKKSRKEKYLKRMAYCRLTTKHPQGRAVGVEAPPK